MASILTLPNIDVIFKKIAKTFTMRTSKDPVFLIIKDDTSTTFTTKIYTDVDLVVDDEELYTAGNLQYIKDCFVGEPASVTVIRIGTTDTITDALAIADTLIFSGWISMAGGTATDYDALIAFVEAQNAKYKTFKTIVFSPTTSPDNTHVVNFANEHITFKDSRAEQTGDKFIPTLLGYLAGASVLTGTTYKIMSNLKSVEEPSNVNDAINAGKLVLINDDDGENAVVRIGLGVNSLTTLTDDITEDYKFLEIIEATDLMTVDIRNTYKNYYVNKYKNTLGNQNIFISAVNDYYTTLETQNILNPDFDNICMINTVAQQAAWVADGKTEASSWDEATVEANPFKRKLFIKSNIKIDFAMTDLEFTNIME